MPPLARASPPVPASALPATTAQTPKAQSKPRVRSTKYTPELGAEICERLADGESLEAICSDAHMPSEAAVRSWSLDPEHPICERYAAARRVGYMRMADEILAIADDTERDAVQARLAVDTRKWLLCKCLPKVFGDKIVQEHTGKDGAAIQQVVRIERVIVDPKNPHS